MLIRVITTCREAVSGAGRHVDQGKWSTDNKETATTDGVSRHLAGRAQTSILISNNAFEILECMYVWFCDGNFSQSLGIV